MKTSESTPNETASNASFEFDALHEAKNYRKALMQEFGPFLKDRVMEVGAGIGQMTREIKKVPGVAHILAVEPDSKFCAELKVRSTGINVLNGIASQVPEKNWNSLVAINVLEHIEHDQAELQTFASLLKAKRGHLCLFVPARAEIYSPLDKDFGHFRRYSKPELKLKLEKAGFKIVQLKYFNFIGYFGWWWTFCVLKKRHFDISSVRVFDRFIFPVGYAMERSILPPPFGQSLLVVAQAI